MKEKLTIEMFCIDCEFALCDVRGYKCSRTGKEINIGTDYCLEEMLLEFFPYQRQPDFIGKIKRL